jgi:hypothetical protein
VQSDGESEASDKEYIRSTKLELHTVELSVNKRPYHFDVIIAGI